MSAWKRQVKELNKLKKKQKLVRKEKHERIKAILLENKAQGKAGTNIVGWKLDENDNPVVVQEGE